MADSLSALDALSGLLLATSLASERFVTVVKTLCPWLAVEKTSESQAVALRADRSRRLTVLALAFLGSYVTLGLLYGHWGAGFAVPVGDGSYPLVALAFLASSGSAFWTGVVGYVKQVKDTKEAQKQEVRLGNLERAKSLGLSAPSEEMQGKTAAK
jgi:hypothetical protein